MNKKIKVPTQKITRDESAYRNFIGLMEKNCLGFSFRIKTTQKENLNWFLEALRKR